MLNAFRHQSGSHTFITITLSEGNPCSTPSGIKAVLTYARCAGRSGARGAQRLPASKRFSHLEPRDRGVAEAVLNAFRHQSGSHLRCVVSTQSSYMCSTPSGIKAVLTARGDAPARAAQGAQRLPASKRFSLVESGNAVPVRWVLNAFRHQSGSHARYRAGPRCPRCAQRLPASKRFSLCGGAGHRGPVPVLNAFRHQSGSHPSWVSMDGGVMNPCSTPSGIKAVLTPGRVLDDRAFPVLNAFRHQSGSHRGVRFDRL